MKIPFQDKVVIKNEGTPSFSLSDGKFSDAYLQGSELGSGAFSVVYNAVHRDSGETFAVKVVPQSEMLESEEIRLKQEIAILRSVKHPHILRMHDVYVEHKCYYIVTEKMMGGELFDRLVEKVRFNEKEARDICIPLLDAVAYLHDHKIAHRDLKPENLLLRSKDDFSELKIADFGFATKCYYPESLKTICGTNLYMAPEIYRRKRYGLEVDMWSIGVIMYLLLGGYAPFDEDDESNQKDQICGGVYEFHDQYWSHISRPAIDLISALMTVDRKQRPTSRQALKHAWITEDNAAELEANDLGVNLKAMQRFHAKRKFKAAAWAIMCSNEFMLAASPGNSSKLADEQPNATIRPPSSGKEKANDKTLNSQSTAAA